MLKEKFQSLIKSEDGKSKKNLENAIVFVIILVVTIIIINTIWGENESKKEEKTTQDNSAQLVNSDVESVETSGDTEKSIKQILSKINGVGKVEVLITYSESSQVVAMYNEKNNNSLKIITGQQ